MIKPTLVSTDPEALHSHNQERPTTQLLVDPKTNFGLARIDSIDQSFGIAGGSLGCVDYSRWAVQTPLDSSRKLSEPTAVPAANAKTTMVMASDLLRMVPGIRDDRSGRESRQLQT